MKIHIVQKGDTLWKIAQKYGVDFDQLKSMNTQLSNPDMIMPGMKIKIPTSSGSIKKEFPVKEIPVKEQIIKEQPLVEHPFAQEKPLAMPVKEEIIKEVPKFIPKAPAPIIPEIDVNNYYMVNMANMNIEQPPLQPTYQLPAFEAESQESPESPEIPEKIAPKGMVQPMFMHQPCVPITPVLPGSGLPCLPCLPCPPGHMVPFQQPMFTQPMPYQGVAGQYMGQPMMHMQSPMAEQYGPVSGPMQGGFNPANVSMNPADMYGSMPSITGGTMPYDADFDNDYEFNESPDDMQNIPQNNMPLTPVQGVFDTVQMPQAFPGYTNPMPAWPQAPLNVQPDDCGCGGPSLSLPAYPDITGSGVSPQNFPYLQQGPLIGMEQYSGYPQSVYDQGWASQQLPGQFYGGQSTAPFGWDEQGGQLPGVQVSASQQMPWGVQGQPGGAFQTPWTMQGQPGIPFGYYPQMNPTAGMYGTADNLYGAPQPRPDDESSE